MRANSSRIGRSSFAKTRCQASSRTLNRLNRAIQWPTAFRPWPPRGGEEAAHRLCSAQPGHVGLVSAFNTPMLAHIALCFPFRFSGFLLHRSVAAERPPRHHCRRRSVKLAYAHHHSIHQSIALVAPPQPSPPFPPCNAPICALGEPCLALRRRGYTLAGVPPCPLQWPCFFGAAPAV